MSDKVKFSLSITTELNDWLKVKADNLGVSKNAQIIFLLERIMRDENVPCIRYVDGAKGELGGFKIDDTQT